MKEWLHQCALLVGWLLASAPLSASETSPEGHWAYLPIRRPPIAPAHSAESPIDALITAKLKAHGLQMSPPADRRTLIRRATFDLTGLPPTVEEADAFISDDDPSAFAKVLDRLLASPRYGERWGRHWLDVARYAETKDLVLLFGKDRLQPYAYTYRDYVIKALNADTPYDRFIEEQIAADQMDPPVERWRLAALGFLTVGRLFDNNIHDQIDDQIDTVTRGFLGLTVACARCHNHKYDPIPTEDYYSLYGVFANSERPYNLPLIEEPDRVPGGREFEGSLAKARRALEDHIDEQHALLTDAARLRVAEYLVRVASTKPEFSETSTFLLSLSPDDLRPGLILGWRRYLERAQTNDPVFGLWAELMPLPEPQIPAALRTALEGRRSGRVAVNPLVVGAFLNAGVVTNTAGVAKVYGDLLHSVYDHTRHRPTLAAAEDDLGEAECQLLEVLEGPDSPCSFAKSDTHHHMARVEKDKFGNLVRELDKLAAYATNPPPARAMVVRDAAEIREAHVFVRGSPARLGSVAPRRFLRVLAGADRLPFEHGSGRLDLARAITAPENPLTSRVMVNRVWMHHFGEPLVSSPSDFGSRSEPPVNPELLDYLAWSFRENGWSLKRLHKEIMLSRAYQQASRDCAEARAIDPDNRLLWRANRRRLDFESMRDAMLFVAGRLDSRMGGPSENVAADARNCRRTVYGLVDRQDLPAVFRAFDFACPDQSIERRPRTIVPQQALFAMNAPFMMEQCKAVAQACDAAPAVRAAASADPSPLAIADGLVSFLFETVLGRVPDRNEADGALAFVHNGAGEGMSAVEQLAQVLLMSNEFLFVD